MRSPFSIIGNIPLSTTGSAGETIPLVRARTLSITTRLTFESQIDADAVVYVYYSPDGKNWDTIALTSWAIAFTVSATKQVTKVLDVPEHGYIWVRVTNGSSADALTNVILWYTIQSWDEIGSEIIDEIIKQAIQREKQEETGQST